MPSAHRDDFRIEKMCKIVSFLATIFLDQVDSISELQLEPLHMQIRNDYSNWVADNYVMKTFEGECRNSLSKVH
uniref:AlNc14C111G6406 protein n=1 Tax=Albugo laibachii Nc14 TaxID=890382 RepID=F0WIK6_9STRA|nr:AlNc14C111G6406 [Albugo laibachii Nc14]|eukprot:CCA21090.1 AlNc14C111G6406 [Albugo laibachii Nc14]